MKVVIAAGFTALAMLTAGTASADLYETPPEPTSTDVSSGGMIGNEQMGVSWSTPKVGMGYAAWAGDYRVESGGWPVNFYNTTTPTSSLRTITDYGYRDENGNPSIEQWGTYTNSSGPYEAREFKEYSFTGYSQEKHIRYGSMEYTCENHVCTMAE